MATKPKTKKKNNKTHEWRRVFLSLTGKNLDPEKVTEVLGILPDDRAKRGEPFSKISKCIQGSWALEGGPSNWLIETQMKYILKRIRPVKNQLKKLIKENKTVRYAYLTIAFAPPEGIPNACYCFNSKLINEFTSLGIDIALSIHIIKEWERVFNGKNSK